MKFRAQVSGSRSLTILLTATGGSSAELRVRGSDRVAQDAKDIIAGKPAGKMQPATRAQMIEMIGNQLAGASVRWSLA